MCFCIFHHPVQMRFPDRTVQDKPEVPEKHERLCMQPLSDIVRVCHYHVEFRGAEGTTEIRAVSR